MYRLIQISFFIFISLGLNAQTYKNQRIKRVSEITDTIRVDTLSIVPESCFVLDQNGRTLDTALYKLDYSNAIIIPSQQLKERTSRITIVYRVFPFSFSKEYFNKEQEKLISPDSLMGKQSIRYMAFNVNQKPFGDNIETSGSISRGISFGSNQDAVVNSSLNLQIRGELENNLKIEGAISDKTVPFQPQGNTQRLEEFDRIYLRAYTKKFEVQAGDVEVKSLGGGFLKYSRNVQGLAFSVHDNFISADDTTKVVASASVAKGKFSKNYYTGVEGNQGPYKLSGAEGESYIIVIAGSERVYIDGKLLNRGETNDYTIDYNAAELIFTSTMRVTGNSRISVEFEYTERSYARFVVTSGIEQRFNNTILRVNAFSEKDSKNQPVDQDLSTKQVDLLKNVGDRIDEALILQADSSDYDPNKIMYEKIDTTVNSNIYNIYKHSTNSLTAHFTINFLYLGEGKGNYVQEYSNANGRVYVWVAPINGKPSGSYEPVRLLVTPKRKQMATISVERRFSDLDIISSEVAISRNDINTFSKLDKRNDVGEAVNIGFRKGIKNDSIRKVWISGNGIITSSNFTFIDRYRPVEFERDWNIGQTLTGGNEKDLQLGFGLASKRWNVNISSRGLKIGNDYKGFRNSINWVFRSKWFLHEVDYSNLISSDSLKSSGFNRIRVANDISIGKFITGLRFEGEDNNQKSENTSKLLPTSFRWFQTEVSMGLPDSLPNMVGLSYKYRKDWKSTDSLLKLYSYSQDIGLKARLAKHQNSRLNLYAGYRLFNPIDTALEKTVKRENTVLGRLDYYFVIAKGFITSNLGYELGNGLEPKYQFYYVEVPAGQGVYTWNDYNGNGIKELDEFEIASFKDEAKYIRINLATNSYISANSNAFSAQFDIRPENFIRDTSGISKFTKRLSDQFSFSSRQKNTFSGFSKSANPLMRSVYDSSLISTTQNFRNSIAYNRVSRFFGVEWISSGSTAKQVLANGFEIVRQWSNQVSVWMGVSSGYSLTLNYLFDSKIQESQYFVLRNYSINSNAPNIKLKYLGMLGLSVELGYEFEFAKNTLGKEENRKHTLSAEVDYSVRNRSWVTLVSSFAKIDYNGDLGTPVEYEFLRGFKPGTNATWELKFRRKISNYFEMNIGYNGRYIASGNVIHTGSMEVRAVF